jgi:hypothetical protein
MQKKEQGQKAYMLQQIAAAYRLFDCSVLNTCACLDRAFEDAGNCIVLSSKALLR